MPNRAFLHTLDIFEKRLIPKLVADKNEFIKAASARYADHGTPNFFDLLDKHRDQILATLTAHYRKVIPVFGALALSHVKSRSFKDAEEDDLFTSLATDWVNTQGLKRAHLISETTEADILTAISNGIENGDGTASIASDILNVTDLSDFRSALIARTETHAAANYAGIESVRDAEKKLDVKMLKTWLPTIDDRTRPEHADMEGSEAIPMDEMFIVGGEEMDRPGDPSASPDMVINCRCTLGFEEEKQ